MRIKGKKLEWLVYMYDFNAKEITTYNVLNENFIQDLYTQVRRKKIVDRLDLRDYIVKYMRYHYWSKTEYEILIGDLFEKNISNFDKIDVFNQVMLNIDKLIDYVNTELKIGF